MSNQSDLAKSAAGFNGDPLSIDTANNRVGVGTVSPSTKLHVNSTNTSSEALATFDRSDGAVSSQIYYDGSDGCMSFGTTTNHPIAFDTNNTERLRIDASGRVTMPSQPSFRYNGNTSQWLTFSSAATWYRFTSGTGDGAQGTGTMGVNLSTNASGSRSSSDFNTSTGRFTAPTAGMYLFTFSSYFTKIVSANPYIHINAEINGSAQNDFTIWGYHAGTNGYPDGVGCTWVLYMSANDTFAPLMYNSTSNAYKIYGDYFRFSGHLLG